MSDVLLYNALRRNFQLTSGLTETATADGFAAGFPVGVATAPAPGFTSAAAQVGFNPETATMAWKTIPRMASEVGSLRVCDTSTFFRCGAACTWTVPAGVTCAEFQIWGPGGGTSSQCCCGAAPFGPTGAWAVATLPVIAGNVYTLTAGCATCCYATQTTPGLAGTSSTVTGPGLSGFCAMGGNSDVCNWRGSLAATPTNLAGNCYPGGSGCQFPSGFGCGPESCSGWTYCNNNITGDRIRLVDFSFSCITKWAGTAVGGTVRGLSGMFPIVNHGGMAVAFNQGCTIAAPVYGFETVSQCRIDFNGTTCSGCNRAPGIGGIPIMTNPGSGGAGGPVYGGCNACGGDSGRMGMVCVRWK